MKSRHLRHGSIDAFRDEARRRLPRGLFEFINRGTEDEVAVRNNTAGFERLKLRPRVLVDVSNRSAQTTLFGRRLSMPLAIAPTGAAGLVHHGGDLAMARAAAAAGVPFTLATRSMSSIEEVAAEAGGLLWFQLYPSSPSAPEVMARAHRAGCEVLVVTVDTPVTPLRRYNQKNGFALPFRPSPRALADMARHPRWCAAVLGRWLQDGGLPRFENLPGRPRITEGAPAAEMLEGRLDWDSLEMLRGRWPGRLLVKGLLHEMDAAKAADLGADGVIVSNHGGRNLDASIAPVDALPGIVAEVGARIPVLMDGGVRRGSDIAKALALGASAVLIGRPALYGAAAAGEAGVASVLTILRQELDYAQAMTGCPQIDDFGPGVLVSSP